LENKIGTYKITEKPPKSWKYAETQHLLYSFTKGNKLKLNLTTQPYFNKKTSKAPGCQQT